MSDEQGPDEQGPDGQAPGGKAPAGQAPGGQVSGGTTDEDTSHGSGGSGGGLSERDRAVLDIAGRTWAGPGPRERAIRERLDISPTAYFQLLNALLDDPRALRHAPVTVNRLRAERDRHRAAR